MKLSWYLWISSSTVLLDFQDEIKMFKLWDLLNPTACDSEINIHIAAGPTMEDVQVYPVQEFLPPLCKRSVWTQLELWMEEDYMYKILHLAL